MAGQRGARPGIRGLKQVEPERSSFGAFASFRLPGVEDGGHDER